MLYFPGGNHGILGLSLQGKCVGKSTEYLTFFICNSVLMELFFKVWCYNATTCLHAHEEDCLWTLLCGLPTTVANGVLGLHTSEGMGGEEGRKMKITRGGWRYGRFELPTRTNFGIPTQWLTHLKRKTEAKFLICQTQGIQPLSSCRASLSQTETTSTNLLVREMVGFKVSMVIEDQPPEQGEEEPRTNKGKEEKQVNISPFHIKHCVEEIVKILSPPETGWCRNKSL